MTPEAEGVVAWFAQTFPTELAELVRRVQSKSSGRFESFVVDDAVIAFFASVLPRTQLAAWAPRPGTRFRHWSDDRRMPEAFSSYVSWLYYEMRRARADWEKEKEAEEQAARLAAVAKQTAAARQELDRLFTDEAALISKFCDVAYRKVRTRDEYGEEQWDALDREIDVVASKLRKKQPELFAKLWRASDADREARGFSKFLRSTAEERKEARERQTSAPPLFREHLRVIFNSHHARRSEATPNTTEVDTMTGVDFEAYLMDRLIKLGASEVSGTAATGDQGGDVLFVFARCRVVVQCKRYSGTVGNKAVQEAYAAKGFYGCSRAWVVTNNNFTPAARALASSLDVTLIARDDLPRLEDFLTRLGR